MKAIYYRVCTGTYDIAQGNEVFNGIDCCTLMVTVYKLLLMMEDSGNCLVWNFDKSRQLLAAELSAHTV